jgi:hypothetical protein
VIKKEQKRGNTATDSDKENLKQISSDFQGAPSFYDQDLEKWMS